MNNHILKEDQIHAFLETLLESEKSPNTIAKYQRDLNGFLLYCGCSSEVCRETVLSYKDHLRERYAISSANSMLAALNSFFRAMGWTDCVVKAWKTQASTFRRRERELTIQEYHSLLRAAQSKGNWRLYLLMMTIASTGIRISEHPFITAEAVHSGCAQVTLKGKSRVVLLPAALCPKLLCYAEEKGIQSGSIFVTRNGKPMDRSNICHAMKRLSHATGIDREKLYPHNLRHLFAVRYYEAEHDLARLADVLGHSNVNTTRIYTMVSEEEQMQHINRLGMVI